MGGTESMKKNLNFLDFFLNFLQKSHVPKNPNEDPSDFFQSRDIQENEGEPFGGKMPLL